jgi:hypothetical protein
MSFIETSRTVERWIENGEFSVDRGIKEDNVRQTFQSIAGMSSPTVIIECLFPGCRLMRGKSLTCRQAIPNIS